MPTTIDIPHDPTQPKGRWVPKDHQREVWAYLERGGKRAIEIWHRRSGKDELGLAWACVAAHQEVGNYWHMLPEASQARKAIWEAIDHRHQRRIDVAFPKALRKNTRNSDMLIELTVGSTWQVVGSDNYDSLVGSTPRGIVFSEWALADPQAWAYLKPILEENGGWALFITTSRGPNHAKRMYESALVNDDWHASVMTAKDTGLMDEVALARIRKEYVSDFGEVVGGALFDQEYMCSFEAAILGAVYGAEMGTARKEGRITEVPYDKSLPVETWWDLGYRDSTAIWFIQRQGGKLLAIDYYENNLAGLDHYVQELQARNYVYSHHLVPHDAGQGEVGPGKSLVSQASELGLRMERQPQAPLLPGINATRPVIARMWFDAIKCQRGIDALTNYRYKWDEARHTLSPKPLHDWASHGADALRTGAMAKNYLHGDNRHIRRGIKRV